MRQTPNLLWGFPTGGSNPTIPAQKRSLKNTTAKVGRL